MANYQDIKGFNIQSKSSDPVPYAQELIDNPYAGVWSSGGSLNTARIQMGGTGISTASIVAGGGPTGLAVAETYNGSSWTEVNDLNQQRYSLGAAGTSTAAVAFAGYYDPAGAKDETEVWNGTSWTEVNDLNTARAGVAQAGHVNTSALCIAGGPPNIAITEKWDGSSWTESGDIPTGTQQGTGFGATNTAAIFAAGETDPGRVSTAYQFGGTSWTEIAELNQAKNTLSGAGTTTDGLVYGGETPSLTANTESWNGTSWTEVNNLGTARAKMSSGMGRGSAALAVGGITPPATAATEEWAFSGLPPSTPAVGYSDSIVGDMYYNSTIGQFKAIKTGGAPVGTWASGGNLNTTRSSLSSAGTQTAMIAMGGEPDRTDSETYNGTSWTSQPSTNDPHYQGTGFGTQTSALVAGGFDSPTTSNNVELWGGSSWTTSTDMTNKRYTASGSPGAPQSAGIVFGGANAWPTSSGSVTALVESWNGSSWTEVGDLNNTRAYSSGAGLQTAALAISGYVGWTGAPPAPPTLAVNVESYNGTSWTEVGDVNTKRFIFNASFGVQTSAVSAGGEDPSQSAKVEGYDGTSWTEVNDLSTARGRGAAAGTTPAGILTGGGPPDTAATEEFTSADFEIKTVTTS